MIITQSMIEQLNACDPGLMAGEITQVFGLPYHDMVARLRQQGYTEHAAWIVVNRGRFIAMTENHKLGRFRIRWPQGHNYCYYDTLDQARAGAVDMKSQYLAQESQRFVMSRVETLHNGDQVWHNIGATADCPESGHYKVFNHVLGQYEDFHSWSLAQQRRQQLQSEFMQFDMTIEQEVSLSDSSLSGWITVDTVTP